MNFTPAVSEENVRSALALVQDPYLGADLITAGVVKSIQLDDQALTIHLKFNYPVGAIQAEQLTVMIQTAVQPMVGPRKIDVNIDWKVNQHLAQSQIKAKSGIKNILAVASGKGGVGKSTVAVNLALAIQATGATVGILDADIYGPSQPLMLGIQAKPVVREDKRFEPVMQYGLQTMSIGYLVSEESAMIWRGPMVSSALQQLLGETAWDQLDYLIVDLPPGTGDIQLTLAQKIPVSGAIIVTTPQDVALLDANKAMAMFSKLGISILGVIENMSVHVCTHCGHEEWTFGGEGGKRLAVHYDVPLLGQLPLDIKIREQSDKGVPVVISEPNGKIAHLYHEIARHVTAKLSLQPRDYSVPCTTTVS